MNRKKIKKSRQKKAAAALILALILSLSPCTVFYGGNVNAEAATFTITKLKKDSIIRDGYFYFYGSLMLPEVFYWIKSDGSPLFCIQKKANIVSDLYGNEVVEEYDGSSYLDEERYELVSLVLQCCGMIQGENPVLEPGTYLAGQAAVWGITSPNWKGTLHFRQEMETVHAHIEDWYDTPAEEILAQSQETVDRICEAIDAYYGDESPYIPAFASKYEKKAPVWPASRRDDGSCEAVFMLDDKSEAIKEFEFQMPEGWSCEWQDDKVTFRCEQAKEGLVSFEGRSKEGSVLDEAMPIGLIHIVGPANFPHFQRLASEVECRTNWSCYFKLLVPEPEDMGSWYLPEVHHYRHHETFAAVYGAGIEKLDGESLEPISGVEFQPLEYFDARQLDNTRLDKEQIESWKGWRARCAPEITDQDGHLEHWDEREYTYEKTYCSGHPEPEITYTGSSEKQREQLEKEALEAWENEVEECSRICDFHCIDGGGEGMLKEDRDLTYQQFIHLIYGYCFKETKAAPGYLPYEGQGGDGRTGKVFLSSVQAGGEWQEEIQGEMPEELQEEKQKDWPEAELSIHTVGNVQAVWEKYASGSNAGQEEQDEKQGEEDAKKGDDKKEDAEGADVEEVIKADTEEAPIGRNTLKRMKKTQRRRAEGYVWMTSLVVPMTQELPDNMPPYSFTVRNYREKPPEETPPEETPPEETPPETQPEETPPEETSPEETLPPEEPSEAEPPKETIPESSAPVDSHSPGGSGGRRKVEVLTPETPPETSVFFHVEEEPVPQAVSRMGWIEAEYATPSVVRKGKNSEDNLPSSLPKTGDRGIAEVVLLLLCIGSGGVILFLLKKRGSAAVFFLGLVFCGLWTGELRAEELQAEEKERMNSPVWQTEIGENQLIVYYSKEEVSGGNEDTVEEREEDRKPEEERTPEESIKPKEGIKTGGGIKESIVDEAGQQYWLQSCQLVSRILPEREEWVSEKVIYSAVETDGQIPENLWFQAEEKDTGRVGEGELWRVSVESSAPYWDDHFQIPLRFCDYDAETYQLQKMEVPKERALEYLIEHQQELLEAVGCFPSAYQLDEIIWTGEPYPVQGILYRDALAYGKKRVSDCLAEYAGKLIYPEGKQEQWEAVYTLPLFPVLLPESEETEAAKTRPAETETAEEEPIMPPKKSTFSWIQLRRIAAYTVSFAVLLPVIGYFFLLISRKKRSSAE